MNFELPENQKEISDAEWEQVQKDRIFLIERSHKETNTPSLSYAHIFGNLNASIDSCVWMGRRHDAHDNYKEAVRGVEYMKKYFKLLEDYPEFAKKELDRGDGYFPKDGRFNTDDAEELIDKYEEVLSGGDSK